MMFTKFSNWQRITQKPLNEPAHTSYSIHPLKLATNCRTTHKSTQTQTSNMNFFLTLFSTIFVCCAPSVLALQNKYCQLSCDFVIKTVSHTVCDREQERCGPGERCGPNFKKIALSDRNRQYIVDLHNYLRNRVAMGNETRSKQPPASNMNVLTYNKELEFIAQCWANSCNGNPLIHDKCRRTIEYSHVGQNLGFINSSTANIDVQKSLKQLIMLWYEEVTIFDKEWVRNTQDRGPNYKVGHYTQMMWADTSEVGCAASFYTTETGGKRWNHIVLVCNYGPGENYLGLPVYNVGKPCSECSNGLKPNQHYRGLCGNAQQVIGQNISNENIFEF